jgi:hypothetical protein
MVVSLPLIKSSHSVKIRVANSISREDAKLVPLHLMYNAKVVTRGSDGGTNTATLHPLLYPDLCIVCYRQQSHRLHLHYSSYLTDIVFSYYASMSESYNYMIIKIKSSQYISIGRSNLVPVLLYYSRLTLLGRTRAQVDIQYATSLRKVP